MKKGKPRYIEANGQRRRLFEWAAFTGVTKSTIRARLARGWGEVDAVTRRIRQNRQLDITTETAGTSGTGNQSVAVESGERVSQNSEKV